MNIRYFPPVAAIAGFGKIIARRVCFKGDNTGPRLVIADGERHRVFRFMQAGPDDKMSGDSVVRLTIRFRFARFSPRTNRFLSLLPVPVIAGMPGILQKIWTYCDETGFSQGIYLFESKVSAEAYLRSPVVGALKRRAEKGSFSWNIEEVVQSALTPDATDQQKEEASGTDP